MENKPSTGNVINFPLIYNLQVAGKESTLDKLRAIRRLFNSLDIEDQDLGNSGVIMPRKHG